MQNRETLLRQYYCPADDGFWQWQDQGESIAWSDGKTIAFAEELSAVLKQLAPLGLPRFGALLLLIAATRKNWAVDGSEAGILAGILLSHVERQSDTDATKDTDPLLQRALAGLHRVRALDSSLRQSLEAKVALAQAVFEDQQPSVQSNEAALVADAIRPGLLPLITPPSDAVSSGYGAATLLQDLAALVSGLDRIHPESIRLRLKTGLSALPVPADIEVPPEEILPSDKARQLIDKLLESNEHAALARIAKQLFASTCLPRRLTEAHEQEVGGFSDIANRGSPDRLLLSELAQDGLTLAVRIAMNEALYLHRETPPSAPRLRRELLIDSGVRVWGTPRAIAAAAALALVATTPKTTSLQTWRGSGSALEEVDLTTEEGLIDHLAVLEPDPHLADALPEFSKRIENSEEPVEAILVMPEDALSDDEFAHSLRSLDVDHLYLATVGRQGEFRLTERRTRGEKLIHKARVDLDQLLENDKSLVDTSKTTSLPAVFRVEPFPLLLPHAVTTENTWSLGQWGALTITGDGRLLRWTDPKKGGEQLALDLPKGKLWWASPSCVQGVTQFVYGSANSPCFFRVDIPRKDVQRIWLDCAPIRGVAFHNDALFCVSEGQISEMDLDSGKAVQSLSLPRSLKCRGGRFFRHTNGDWYALSHTGHKSVVEPLPGMTSRSDPVIHMWEAEGFEGSVALTLSGKLLNPKKKLHLDPKITRCQLQSTSPDGMVLHLFVEKNGIGSNISVELQFRSEQLFHRIAYGTRDQRVQALVRDMPLRKRFRSVGVSAAGQLMLRSNKQQLVGMVVENGLPLLKVLPQNQQLVHEQNLLPEDDDGLRLKLSRASWPDGSRAVLDSRGLLHLQPANQTIPEVTLVLSEGELTGWCDDGRTFGREYFLSDSRQSVLYATEQVKLYEQTIARFVEAVRAAN